MRIGDAIGEVPDILHATEMPKPDTDLGIGVSNVVVLALDGRQREGEVVQYHEDLVAHFHQVRKVHDVVLVGWKIVTSYMPQIPRIGLEVQADKAL